MPPDSKRCERQIGNPLWGAQIQTWLYEGAWHWALLIDGLARISCMGEAACGLPTREAAKAAAEEAMQRGGNDG